MIIFVSQIFRCHESPTFSYFIRKSKGELEARKEISFIFYILLRPRIRFQMILLKTLACLLGVVRLGLFLVVIIVLNPVGMGLIVVKIGLPTVVIRGIFVVMMVEGIMLSEDVENIMSVPGFAVSVTPGIKVSVTPGGAVGPPDTPSSMMMVT